MPLTSWKKLVAGAFGTIALGALGSGLWEQVFRPAAQWIGDAILTTATLGSATIKNQIYREAAKGMHEASGLGALEFMTMALLFIAIIPLAFVWVDWTTLRRLSKFLSDALSGTELRDYETSQRRRHANLVSFVRSELRVLCLMTLLLCGIKMVQFLKISQANISYTYYRQAMLICRPYMDEHQAELIESRFASIQGREDYINVITELQSIAKANQRSLAKFDPW